MTRAALAIGAIIALCGLATSCSHYVAGGPYGRVKIAQPAGQADSVIILFSDRNGITRADDVTAQSMAEAGALVVEVNSTTYLSRLDQRHEKCHNLESDVDWFSREL
jgi:type IV secretory pathway VirJ component